MLEFEMDVAATDLVARTIEGTMVPYGEVANIGGADYRFQPGSVKLARQRTPLLVDHNRGDPVGVLAELVESDAGLLARFRVDPTPAGDTALVQAASGSRGSLSIGAEVDDALELEGVNEVAAARVFEVSLTALGAFDGANVTRVAASMVDESGGQDPDHPANEPDEPKPDEPYYDPNPDQTTIDQPDPDDAPPTAPPSPTEGGTVEATKTAPVILADRQPKPNELKAGELVTLMIRAQRGERDAVRYLEAALAETISTDVTGLLPPQYEKTILGGKAVPRTLYGVFGGRPLPGVGLAVNKPKWTTPPAGTWAANVDADATSSKVVIGSQAASILRWDWAGAISWVVVERSDPSIVDEIYAEAVQDFYNDVEIKIKDQMVAAAGTADASDTLGEGLAAFHLKSNGKTPEIVLMAPDAFGKLADANQLNSSVAAGTPSATGTLQTTWAGLPVAVSGALPATSRFLATRRAIDARTTEPVRLTANAIGALNVELAVVGEALFDTDYPSEIMLLTAAA